MQRSPLSRQARTALAGLLGLALSACEGAPAPLLPEQAHSSRGVEQRRTADLNRQLAALRQATAAFHDFDRAKEAGYGAEITPCWYHRERGAQGYHYGRPGLIGDGAVALLQPELLQYEPKRGGGMRLVGVEYIVPAADWKGESPPALLGQEFHLNARLGIYALHVWLWRDNPDGMFADWNPAVSCEHAAVSEDRVP
jgi:hypothetical protein